MALHYDIKSIPSRPQNKWFVGSMGPPMKEKIFIRRRSEAIARVDSGIDLSHRESVCFNDNE